MQILLNDKRIIVPRFWNEMPKKQLLDVFDIICNENILPYQRLILLTLYFINKKSNFLKKWEQQTHHPIQFYSELNKLVKACTEKFIKQKNEKLKLVGYLTKPSFNIIRIKGKVYGIFDLNIDNITVLEFAWLETYYQLIVNDSNSFEQNIELIIAILFRPSKPKNKINKQNNYNGDQRIKFNPNIVSKNASFFKNIPLSQKKLIFFYYTSVRQIIINKLKPRLKKTGTSEQKTNGISSWIRIIMILAGDKFGDIEKTGNTSIAVIIEYLNLKEEIELY